MKKFILVLVLLFCLINLVTSFNFTDEVIVYYDFNATAGTFLHDLSNTFNGTLIDMADARWVDGKVGGGLLFDGVDDYVNTTWVDSFGLADDFTLSFWWNTTNGVSSSHEFFGVFSGDTSKFGHDYVGGLKIRFAFVSAGTSTLVTTVTSPINDNTFKHYVIVRNTTRDNYELFVDGVSEVNVTDSADAPIDFTDFAVVLGATNIQGTAASFTDGVMDEFGVWGRAISLGEVRELYNNGGGLAFGNQISSTLNSPSDNTETNDATITFNVTVQPEGVNATNSTIFIWYTNGTIFDVTTNLFPVGSDETLFSTWDITNFQVSNYTWNVESCGTIKAGASFCSFAVANFSLEWLKVLEVSESFTQEIISGTTSKFVLNISIANAGILTQANLSYNGTMNLGTIVSLGDGDYSLSKSIQAPEIDAETNFTFFWSLKLGDETSFNSTRHNQTVSVLGVDNCSTFTNVIFNFTLLDEEEQTLLGGVTDKTSIKIDLILSSIVDGSQVINFSAWFNQTNPAPICLENPLGDSVFRVDGVIEYSADSRFTEFYNLQNYTLDATANGNVSLFNLNSSVGQEFRITYKDSNFVPVIGAIMQIQRKYVDEGLFKTTEIPKTGVEGYSIAHLVSSDVIYNIIILKEGVVLDSFTDIVADCQNPLISSCSINLNSFSSGVLPNKFSSGKDFAFTLDFDKETKIISAVFVVPSGGSAAVGLNVTLYDTLGNTPICSDTLISSGGALSCAVPEAFGNSTIVAKLFKGDVLQGYAIVNMGSNPSDIYGASLIFIALFGVIFLVGIGISDNPMIMGIMLILGSIILVSLNILSSSSWVGVGATILWFIVAIVIVLMKGSDRQ